MARNKKNIISAWAKAISRKDRKAASKHEVRATPRPQHVMATAPISERSPSSDMAAAGEGPGWSVRTIEMEDMMSHMDYMAAHRLLPPTFVPGETYGQPQEHALAVIKNRASTPEAILEAIVILGHSPLPDSLAALEVHAASDEPYAEVAARALEECLDLLSLSALRAA